MTTAKDIISKLSQLFPASTAKDPQVIKDFITVVEQFNEDTVEDVFVELLEDPFAYNTREAVRDILMEDLSSDFDCGGTEFCDNLFRLLDFEKQQ